MLIMIHGTGDDSTKKENWIPWVSELYEAEGRPVLVLPGVGSGQQGELINIGRDFLLSFLRQHPNKQRDLPNIQRIPALDAALRAAASTRSEIGPLIDTHLISELDFNKILKEIERKFTARGKEGRTSAIGIKSRASVAALCAIAYYTHVRGDPQIIRLIGHSRGGSAVIATHNLLRFNGIKNVKTLALDPCHGVKKFGAKDYTHVVYSGTVTSIPVVKEVGFSWAPNYTLRQPITLGQGADQEAHVYNTPHLKQIKHGHMGKLTTFSKPSSLQKKLNTSAAQQLIRIKEEGYQTISTDVGKILSRDKVLKEKLEELFKMTQDKDGDLRDKKLIQEYVSWNLFSVDMSLNDRLRALPCYALIDEYEGIARGNVANQEVKQQTVAKLNKLLSTEPGKGVDVVRALVKFKIARKGWSKKDIDQDADLFNLWNVLYQNLGVEEEDNLAQNKSNYRQTDEKPTFRELLELVRNRNSGLLAKQIPQTFKDFLISLDQPTMNRVINQDPGIREFLRSNNVVRA